MHLQERERDKRPRMRRFIPHSFERRVVQSALCGLLGYSGVDGDWTRSRTRLIVWSEEASMIRRGPVHRLCKC
ncbi:uncharacterized protein LAESUDRAFT_725536 [Laetiporus sulphureus 93-53]|uniref:Uncharacterized protein n=1 Tax=Laetiporus sulphureus 93-53 TaxID=1314785 RepID=A0A165ED61_9APHY|nr:uncharacterized protein LAESUDRAFT_725536 [Laetiporus sulphureus 93-53]KZT06778.1 hypothetical protein LAESUDRAFT_725536 [Laetiporus sulphureus 93-53]